MVKKLSLRHFFITFIIFWAATLLGAHYGIDICFLNLVCAGLLLILFNPTDLEHKYLIRLICCFAAILAITLVLPAKIWSCWLFLALIIFLFFVSKKRENFDVLIISTAAFFHLAFVSNTSFNAIQHDFASCINYMQYIMENNFLFFKENPLLTRPSYSAYHPILHFFLAALLLKTGDMFQFSGNASIEGAQVLFVFYMFWYGFAAARILRFFNLEPKSYLILLSFVVFFPIYNAISGYFNNDGLLLPLQAEIIYYSLCYYKTGLKKNLFIICLFSTLAALTKLSGILVLPMTAAICLMRLFKQKNLKTFYELAIFGLCTLVGISLWPLYQYFVLHIGFGYVPDLSDLSLEPYSFWERFSPLKAFIYEERFGLNVNLWETMTKTALFGEDDWSYRGASIMFILDFEILLYKCILLAAIGSAGYLIFKACDKKILWLTLILIIGLLGGHIAFIYGHPFRCNQDFRYVAILPLAFAMIFAQLIKQAPSLIEHLLYVLLILFAFVASFSWQWILL